MPAGAMPSKLTASGQSAGLKGNYGWLLYKGFNQAQRGYDLVQAAVELMESAQLSRAHSNITLEQLRIRLAELEKALPSGA